MSRTVWIILAILALAFAAITGLAVKRGILGSQRRRELCDAGVAIRRHLGQSTCDRPLDG